MLRTPSGRWSTPDWDSHLCCGHERTPGPRTRALGMQAFHSRRASLVSPWELSSRLLWQRKSDKAHQSHRASLHVEMPRLQQKKET